jgi:hypothetical protein
VGEDLGQAVGAGHAGDGGHVGRQGHGRQRLLTHDHRMEEFDGDVLGIGGRPTGSEDDELAAPGEAHRHVVGGPRDPFGLFGQNQSRLRPPVDLGPGRRHRRTLRALAQMPFMLRRGVSSATAGSGRDWASARRHR